MDAGAISQLDPAIAVIFIGTLMLVVLFRFINSMLNRQDRRLEHMTTNMINQLVNVEDAIKEQDRKQRRVMRGVTSAIQVMANENAKRDRETHRLLEANLNDTQLARLKRIRDTDEIDKAGA